MVSEKKIKEIVKRIANKFEPERIILFGSYVNGHPKKDSDMDLLIVVRESSQPRFKRAREIRKHLWGITDIPKDILVYTQTEFEDMAMDHSSLFFRIKSAGRILYEAA